MKRILSNPSILFLIAGNLYCIWYYKKYPEDFATIVWIYWFQSIIIGFFNFLELLTAKNTIGNITTVNKSPKELSKGCSAFFFLFHYGIFHLVYFIFKSHYCYRLFSLFIRQCGSIFFQIKKPNNRNCS